MMTFVLNAIEMKGFRLLCSADVSGKYVSNDNNHHTLGCLFIFLLKNNKYFNYLYYFRFALVVFSKLNFF